jgi:hypothetical protein
MHTKVGFLGLKKFEKLNSTASFVDSVFVLSQEETHLPPNFPSHSPKKTKLPQKSQLDERVQLGFQRVISLHGYVCMPFLSVSLFDSEHG